MAIVAAATVLGEPVPSAPLGGLRAFRLVAVSAGVFVLANPTTPLPVGPLEQAVIAVEQGEDRPARIALGQSRAAGRRS